MVKKRANQEEPIPAKKAKREKKSKQTDICAVTTSTGMDPVEFRSSMNIHIKTNTSGDAVPDPVQSLDAAPFSKRIRRALKDAGFTAPTPIQSQAWPIAVRGDDLIAVAKTGSGKTLAFLLPAFRMLSKKKPDCSQGPAVLVLAPTRELAVQIGEAAEKFAGDNVSCCIVYGGVPRPPQIKTLRTTSPQLVVATPGRLVDLINDGAVKLGNVCFFVLDEADRMLDMGFQPQMVEVMKQVPKEGRQTMMFSATWPKPIKKLAALYLSPATVHVNIGDNSGDLEANKAVSQQFFKLDDSEKDRKLWAILDTFTDKEKCIVFANTKRRINKLSGDVWAAGYDCVIMSGDKTQRERDQGLRDFAAGISQLMFATDVCSRGLDIKGVTHVVNYDMARDVESYIHRIGRTGRAGSTGASITFVNEDYDVPCSPALAKIAREAGQDVPEWLEKLVAKAATCKKDKQWVY